MDTDAYSEVFPEEVRRLAVDCLRNLLRILGFNAGSVYLPVPGSKNVFHIVYSEGFSREYLSETDTITRGEGFCGTALALNEARLSEDVANDARYNRQQIKIDGFHSFIALPISPEVGLINMASYDFIQFDSKTIALLNYSQSTLANAITLEMKKRELENNLQVSEHLSYLLRELTSAGNPVELSGLIAEETRRTLRTTLSIVLITDDKDVTVAARGINSHSISKELRNALLECRQRKGVFSLGEYAELPAIRSLIDRTESDFLCENLHCLSGYRGCICVGFKTTGERTPSTSPAPLFVDALSRITAQAVRALNRKENERQQIRLAVVDEYSRISRETHDVMAQEIISVQRMVEAIRVLLPEETRAALAEPFSDLLETIHVLYSDTREIISELRVFEKADSFDGALVQTVELFRKHFDGEVHLECQQSLSMPTAATHHLLRILQEACTNIRKHSEAQTAVITIAREGSDIICKIADDGVGFDPESVKEDESFGIDIMRERAKNFGGSVRVDSAIGVGTTVTVTIPISEGGAP